MKNENNKEFKNINNSAITFKALESSKLEVLKAKNIELF